MTTWVVAADSSRARILSCQNRQGHLEEVEALVRPESRLHGQALQSDGPGRAFDSGGQGRHAMEPKVDVKQQEAIRFAKQVCDTLTAAHGQGRFSKLYIVAAPAFLGLLRDGLHAPVHQAIAGSVAKNMASHGLDEIRSHLPDFL